MESDTAFVLGSQANVEKLKQDREKLHHQLHTAFLEAILDDKVGPLHVLNKWGHWHANDPHYIFRVLTDDKDNLQKRPLFYRPQDYPIANKQSKDYYAPGKGCSLFNLWGLIYKGVVSGPVYISPKCTRKEERLTLQHLNPEFVLVEDKPKDDEFPINHYALGISKDYNTKDASDQNHVSVEKLTDLLKAYNTHFRNTGVVVTKFQGKSNDDNARIVYAKDLTRKFYQSEFLKQEEYAEIYEQIMDLHQALVGNDKEIIHQILVVFQQQQLQEVAR